MNARVRGITCSASARHGKVMGSMLGRIIVVLLPDAWPKPSYNTLKVVPIAAISDA